MTDERNTIAREYLRVSLDKSGRERSIDEQHEDNVRHAEAVGWTLGDPYRDRGSASRYATNGRDGYDQLIDDLARDRFAADLLVLWESSRGSRRVGEWVTLIELAEVRAVRIHVTSHGRTYDPANARDRRSLLEDAVDSEYETAKLSERAKRAAAANAAAGHPHGAVPYGYRRRYDERTRRLIAQEPHPIEAAIVRELYDRIRRGHSLRSIAHDFERRGVRGRSGTILSPAQLRAMAVRCAYIGERVHKGAVTDGQWDGIVDRGTWLAVQRILTSPERVTTRPGRAKHLLSMIAVCDVCAGPLSARHNRHRPERGADYRCHRGNHVSVPYGQLNDYAEAAIVGYLSRPDNVERLTAQDHGQELEAVRLSIAEIRSELDDLADKVGHGELSATLAARAEPAIQQRLRTAQDREAELSTPPVLRGLVVPGVEVSRRWGAAPMSTKRQVARLLLAPDVLGELRVARSPSPGHTVPIEDRVVWRRT